MGDVPDEPEHDAGDARQRDAAALARPSRSLRLKRGLFVALLLLSAITTTALGIWQIERRAWKLALIEAVDARAHAAPVPPPGPREWNRVTADRDAYRAVRVTGRFDHSRETLIQAMTGRGEGYWLLTPLQTAEGWTVLINRGFLPANGARPSRPAEPQQITGLLRMTEPGHLILRVNDPSANRWYSRDVAAIARARRLKRVAPYFIDADASPNPGGYPVGGLTVIAFRNAHLSYAIIWFALAGLSISGLLLVLRER